MFIFDFQLKASFPLAKLLNIIIHNNIVAILAIQVAYRPFLLKVLKMLIKFNSTVKFVIRFTIANVLSCIRSSNSILPALPPP